MSQQYQISSSNSINNAQYQLNQQNKKQKIFEQNNQNAVKNEQNLLINTQKLPQNQIQLQKNFSQGARNDQKIKQYYGNSGSEIEQNDQLPPSTYNSSIFKKQDFQLKEQQSGPMYEKSHQYNKQNNYNFSYSKNQQSQQLPKSQLNQTGQTKSCSYGLNLQSYSTKQTQQTLPTQSSQQFNCNNNEQENIQNNNSSTNITKSQKKPQIQQNNSSYKFALNNPRYNVNKEINSGRDNKSISATLSYKTYNTPSFNTNQVNKGSFNETKKYNNNTNHSHKNSNELTKSNFTQQNQSDQAKKSYQLKQSLQVKQTNKDQNKNNLIQFFSCFTGNQNESQIETIVDKPTVEFMIKDTDTNQVYDLRMIENIQKFESANKKEYFDKLKKRHSSVWQGWWNKKKENNFKLKNAVRQNDMKQAEQLLSIDMGDLKGDVNVKDENGWIPLHYAALNGNLQMVLLLLQNDSNIDAENNNAQSPLIVAAQKGHVQVLRLLLNYGADVNHQDMHFNTALHYACLFEQLAVIEALLDRPSIQVKLKNSDRKTAFEISNSQQGKQLFEAYKERQQQLVFNANKVTIQEVSNESVFNLFEQEEQSLNQNSQKSQQENKQKQKLQSQQKVYQQSAKNSGIYSKQEQQKKKGLNNQINSQKQISNKYSFNKQNSNKQYTPSSSNGNTYWPSGQTTAYSSPKKTCGPDKFKIINLIGRGSFGEVYLVQDKEDLKQYAMKVLHKSKILGQNLIKYALTERNVLSISQHPFIVKLRFAFQNDKELFLIMDLAPNGDLAKLLRDEQRLSEQRAKIYLAEILTALESLHTNDIIYRDLKPENVVIDAEGHALLTDFGLSKEGVSDHFSASSFCGSLAYLAPEMLKRQGHGKAVDWYHLGVLMYEMLTGQPPFISQDREQIINNIQNQQVKIPNYISSDAKQLIKALMNKNPVQRLGSSQRDGMEIKQHPFFQGIDWNLLYQRKIIPPKIDQQEPIKENKFSVPQNFSWGNGQTGKDSHNYIQGWSFIHPDNSNNNNFKNSIVCENNKDNINSGVNQNKTKQNSVINSRNIPISCQNSMKKSSQQNSEQQYQSQQRNDLSDQNNQIYNYNSKTDYQNTINSNEIQGEIKSEQENSYEQKFNPDQYWKQICFEEQNDTTQLNTINLDQNFINENQENQKIISYQFQQNDNQNELFKLQYEDIQLSCEDQIEIYSIQDSQLQYQFTNFDCDDIECNIYDMN